MQREQPKIPFVGLHAHSVAGSVFDGFGYPQDHMDFAYENGMQALALTDHGNMNGMSYQVLHAKKMKAEGRNFKPIFGVEAYFVPSIEEWKQEYDRIKEDKKQARKVINDTDKVEAEDESASKGKSKSVINSSGHLVLVAMNQTGLNNIFKIVSDSHQGDNFYRKPRLDYDLLKQYGEGVIASSACLGGVYAKDYWNNREAGPDAILEAMRVTTSRMVDCLGDRWYGELQWNNVPEQHELNKYVIKMHEEFN